MVDIRRVFVSLVVGALLLVGAQASAAEVDQAALAVAERGFVLGLAVSAEVAADAADGRLDHRGSARALEALTAVTTRVGSAPQVNGPARALEALERVLERSNPNAQTRGPIQNPGGRPAP